MDDNATTLAALKGQPAQPTADELAAQAHQLMMTQALRDPQTFNPRTYTPTQKMEQFSTDPTDEIYRMGGPGVKHAAEGVYNTVVKNPMDAAYDSAAHQHGAVPISDSYVDPSPAASMESAMGLAGLGTPAAEAGAAGIFGGKLAKGADLAKLEQAQSMMGKGIAHDAVRQTTGWFKGPDGQWRFEIPDENSKMYDLGGGAMSTKAPMRLLFSHPELYKAYPGLRSLSTELEINPHFPDTGGMWNANTGVIGISAPNTEMARAAALHELQHAIQSTEEFSPGTTVGAMKNAMETHPHFFADLGRNLTPFDAYQRTVGETEARNIEIRRNFDAKQRQETAPWDTQDYSTAKQLMLNPINPDNYPVLKQLREAQK